MADVLEDVCFAVYVNDSMPQESQSAEAEPLSDNTSGFQFM